MSQIRQVKEATDIVTVIGQRLNLTRSGSSFRALCPFHTEKSPSFFVNPQLQRYRCFGCGAQGDVLEFLQQYEGMSFYEALQSLAFEAGIQLKHEMRSKDDEEREQLLNLLTLAAKYYHYLLTEHQSGESARQYLQKRQVHQDSIKLFNLGYALPSWDGLFRYLTKKKRFPIKTMLDSGLIVRNQSGRYYDRFRDRIIFPLKNHRGQIVGFSGRILTASLDVDRQQPKYINTPETMLYHKAQTLFGFSELYQNIRTKKEVVVCEGEFDVISSHQAHVSHVVAIKGSALTLEQAKLLERTVEKVVITLDSDQAGIKATKRAIEIIRQTNLDLRVIDLSTVELEPVAQDVDDLVKRSAGSWKKAATQSIPAYEFLINIALRSHDINTAEGRKQVVNELAPIIKGIDHEVEKDFYLKMISAKLGVSQATLAKDIERFGERHTLLPKSTTKNTESTKTLNANKQLEEYLLFILFNSNFTDIMERAQQLLDSGFLTSPLNNLLSSLVSQPTPFSLSTFASQLPEDQKQALMDWMHHPEYFAVLADLDLAKEWKRYFAKYQRHHISKQIDALNQQLSRLGSNNSGDRKTSEATFSQDQLLEEIASLQNKMKHWLIEDS
ncbi:MAG TPA: DNA primase [Candidatus Woesebacteria bacterium]|nr:DNA primase [Candidatus Woesebacteria bacterium]